MTTDERRCPHCGRFDDDARAHQCAGCGAAIPASRFIDVTTLRDRNGPVYVRAIVKKPPTN